MKTSLYRILLTLSIQLLIILSVSAQHINLQVEVVDELSGKSLPFPQVKVIDEQGSKKIFVGDRDGKIVLQKIKAGKLHFILKHMGYKTMDTVLSPIQKSVTLALAPTQIDLKEVTVIAKKPSVEVKRGKIILNVSESPLGSSGNVWEALQSGPTIETSVTGKLTIKNQKATVFINNREVHLAGNELMVFLQSLSASEIDQIEIISHPGASYDSDVQTVINIKTAKASFQGIKNILGTSGALGTFPRYMVSEKLILNRQAYNAQVGYTFNKSKLRNKSFYNSIYRSVHPWAVSQQSDTEQHSHRATLNVDVYATKRSVVSFYSEISPNESNNMTISDNGRPSAERVSRGDSIFTFQANTKNKTLSTFSQLSYELKWDSARQSFKIQTEYFKNKRKYRNIYNSSNYVDGAFVPSGALMDILPQGLNTTVTSGQYKGKLWSGEILSGIRYSYSTLKNENTTLSVTDQAEINKNRLQYRESLYSGFSEWSKEIGKFYLKAGGRIESLNVLAENLTDSSFNRIEMLSFVPSMLLQWEMNDKHRVEFSYKKNISKPDYFQLNSFKRYNGNSLAEFKGDQNIKPQVGHTLDLTWSRDNALIVSTGAQLFKNFISTLFLEDENNTLYEQYTNFPYCNVFYLNGSYQVKVIPAWQIRLNANSFLVSAEYKGIEQVKAGPSVNMTYVNTITLPKNWVVETGVFYQDEYSDGFFEHGSYGKFQAAVQKRFPKANLTMTLVGAMTVRSDNANKALYEGIQYSNRSYSDNQYVRISASWSFGKQNFKSVEKKQSVSDESIERLKGKN